MSYIHFLSNNQLTLTKSKSSTERSQRFQEKQSRALGRWRNTKCASIQNNTLIRETKSITQLNRPI